MNITELSKNLMLVDLSIGKWSNNRQDKVGSETLKREYGIKDHENKNRIRAYKSAINPKNLKGIDRLCNDFRTYFYTVTAPFGNNGPRVLNADYFPIFRAKTREFCQSFDTEVTNIIDNFETWKSESKTELNGAYNEADYPGAHEVQGKYQRKVNFLPFPISDHLQATGLSDIELQEIKTDIENKVKANLENATKDCFDRIEKTIKHLIEKCGQTRENKSGEITAGIFRDSLIENIKELTELIPFLNITKNPDIERARNEMVKKFNDLKPEDLRDDPLLRQSTIAAAEDFLKDLFPATTDAATTDAATTDENLDWLK